MTPFAIAGIQMRVSATESNITAMANRLAVVMHRFPWVQMVLFSELCAYGPSPRFALPLPSPAEIGFCELARRYAERTPRFFPHWRSATPVRSGR